MTSQQTASASELIINCLKPYLNVVTVGDKTHGKPVGMYLFEEEDIDRVVVPITFKLSNAKFNDGSNLKDAESDAFKRACMRFGLGVELWSGSKQSEEEATAAEPEDNVVVTKVDMRKKENKPTPEDIKRMEEIMDSIVGTDE